MPTIVKGENAIVQRNLFASDGTTPVLLSSLTLLHAQVIQYGKVLATYIYEPVADRDDEIRQGTSTSNIEIEITKTLSDTFKEGSVTMKLIMEQTDAEFEVDAVCRDIDEFEIFTVEL